MKGIYVYSPDHKTKVLFEGEGYILNRKLMPKRQVKDAKGFGVEFKFETYRGEAHRRGRLRHEA